MVRVQAANPDFIVRVYRYRFRAVESVYFPPGKAGNVLRGALGKVAAAPERHRPSGLADPPLPFVLRAANLDGRLFEPGQEFSFDVHVFDLESRLAGAMESALTQWALTGLGPRRGRVEYLGSGNNIVAIDLKPAAPASRCSLLFRTPTELKGNRSGTEMPFSVLFARVRDRVSTLRSLYGEGPLQADFRALGEGAAEVRTVRSELQYRDIRRRSSRTGEAHGIGGVTGEVDYEGELARFLPWLRAASWTGVGRHTVWGNGAVEVVHVE